MSKQIPTIQIDEASIYAQLTSLDRAALVRPNNPPRGLAGFLFNYDAEQIMELNAQATDYAVEDNTRLQDNISLMPPIITLRGMIAELTTAIPQDDLPSPVPAPLPLNPALFPPFSPTANLSFGASLGAFGLNAGVTIGPGGIVSASAVVTGAIGPFSADAIVRTVTSQLAGVINLTAGVSAAVNAAINNAVKSLSAGTAPSSSAITAAILSSVSNVVGTALTPAAASVIAQSVNSSISTTAGTNPGPGAGAASSLYQYYVNRSQVQPGQTAQSLAMGYFVQMYLARQLFSVETPWGIMNNMMLQNVRGEQPEDTKYATNFSITLKHLVIANSVTLNLGQLAGRNAFQASVSVPASNGNASTTPATPAQQESWASTLGFGQ